MNRLRVGIVALGLAWVGGGCTQASPAEAADGVGAAASAGATAGGASGAPRGGSGGTLAGTSGNDGDVGGAGSGAAGVGSAGGAGGAGGTGTVTGEGEPLELPGDACFEGRTDLDHSSAHCGQCGHACAPFTLASRLDWPLWIALDETHAFWITNGDDAAVMSAPLAGGDVVTLTATQPWPNGIAVDATHVYWSSGGTISRIARSGGMPERLVQVQIYPQAIAIDATHVYWVDQGDSGNAGAVMKVPLAGGEPITVASAPGGGPTSIALDATHVYWGNGYDDADRMVLKAPLAGGEPITLAQGTSQVYGIAVDARAVYWVGHDTVLGFLGVSIASVVGRTPLAGGTATTLASGTHMPMAIATDGVSAYWTNASTSQVLSAVPGMDGSVMGVPLAGGSDAPLASDVYEPAAIATNGTHVCWTTMGSGQGGGSVQCLGTCSEGVCE